MKIKVKALGENLAEAILMWEEGESKKLVTVKKGDTIDVEDQFGHNLIGTYPDLLEVISYGKSKKAVEKKMVETENLEVV